MSVDTFTFPGSISWLCPTGVYLVQIESYGAAEFTPTGGGLDGYGGGGGGYGKMNAVPVTPGTTYYGQVGAGNNFVLGNRHSWLDGDITGPIGYGSDGGVGGSGTGDVTYTGGNGGVPVGGLNGGGGGGSASPTGDGSNGANGNAGGAGGFSISGGAGGHGGLHTGPVQPIDGFSPGGGPGGEYDSGTVPAGSATGGDGKVIVTYFAYNSYSIRQRGGYGIDPPMGGLFKQRGGYSIRNPFDGILTQRGGYTIGDIAVVSNKYRGGYQVLPPVPISYKLLGGYGIDPPMGGLFVQRGGYRVEFLSKPLVQRGGYRVFGHNTGLVQRGGYRVQNLSVEGYTVYIGTNQLPDLVGSPTTFSSVVPFNIPVTPPVSGKDLLYVVVRKRDSYGLESQNQQYTLITVDSGGGFIMPPVGPPTNLLLMLLGGIDIRVLATYSGFGIDPYPADTWKVWYGTSIPNPFVDVPFLVTPVIGKILSTTIESLSPGLYYVMVGLYRTPDTFLTTVYGSIVVDAIPGRVIPVASGFEELW